MYLSDKFEAGHEQSFYSGIPDESNDDLLTVVCKLPEASIKDFKPELASYHILLDNQAAPDTDKFKVAWHGFLRTYNLFQFMIGSGFFTSEGGEIGAYETLSWRSTIHASSVVDAKSGKAQEEVSEELIEGALEEFHSSLYQLVESKLPLPVAEYELKDGIGECVAEAEFYWEGLRIVGLYDSQVEYSHLFQKAGLEVIELDANAEWLTIFEELVNAISLKE